MRSLLILLVLASVPAICQQNFNAQATPTPQKAPASPILRLMGAKPASTTCSIPLLNVKPAGTPVAMPNMMPKTAVPGNNPWQTNLTDNMKIVAPAPSCPTDFGKVSVPHTAP
jgi:hypothetical protein